MGHLDKKTLRDVESKIGIYPDFPKKGILFRDIMPILGHPELLNTMITALCDKVKHLKPDRILGIESRGFLIGPLVATQLGVPFNAVRKRGKLPGQLYSVEYELEYGKDTLEVQKDSLPVGSRCLIVDDLIATGGSSSAAKKLVELSGSETIGFAVIIELAALNGRLKLGDSPLISLFSY